MGNLNKNRDIDRDIKEFLDAVKNADINAVMRIMRRYGYTDLNFAVIECNVRKIRRLLERGADPNFRNDEGKTPLHDAAEYCPEAIDTLIKYGADPNARDVGGFTPLHIAALEGSVEAAKALIPHADVNARDKEERMPLHLALEYNNCDVAMLLLQHGADPNARDGKGRTPLHLASAAGCVEVVKTLLERGANPSIRDKSGRSPLHYAVMSLSKDVVAIVLKDNDVNAKDVYGETPLMYLLRECARWESRRQQCREIAKLLLEHGADPTIPDARGRTPLDAARLGCSELAELLSGK